MSNHCQSLKKFTARNFEKKTFHILIILQVLVVLKRNTVKTFRIFIKSCQWQDIDLRTITSVSLIKVLWLQCWQSHNKTWSIKAVGMFAYYAKWTPKFSDKIQLLINNTTFSLTTQPIEAFTQLKKQLSLLTKICLLWLNVMPLM